MALTDKLTNIANAIRRKTGGTDTMTLEGMVNAIDGITTGGATVNFTTGVYTPEADTSTYTINHQLGVRPTIIIMLKVDSNNYAQVDYERFLILWVKNDYGLDNNAISVAGLTKPSFNVYREAIDGWANIGATSIGNINNTSFTAGGKFVGGCTYRWIAIAPQE